MIKKIAYLLFTQLIFLVSFAQEFRVSFSPTVYDKPFSGKVILFLDKENKNPKDNMVDVVYFPCFSVDVKDVQPGSSVVFDDKATSFPVKLSDIERGDY